MACNIILDFYTGQKMPALGFGTWQVSKYLNKFFWTCNYLLSIIVRLLIDKNDYFRVKVKNVKSLLKKH